MSESPAKKAHRREMARLRTQRWRQRQRARESAVREGHSPCADFPINEEESIPIKMELNHDSDGGVMEMDLSNRELNVSNEFLECQQSMNTCFSEVNLESSDDDNERNYNTRYEPTLSEDEGDFNYLDESPDDNESEDDVEPNELEAFRQWAIESRISHRQLDPLLRIFGERLLPQLPKSSKTFLKTTSVKYNIEIFDRGNNSEFVYFEIAESLKRIINPKLHEKNEIYLLIHVDGTSPYKSSDTQFWPILGKVYFQPDIYKVFPIAIYNGVGKPHNIHRYLERFVTEINEILQGIVIENKRFNVFLKAFVCDRPARSFMKCIKNHGAHRACEGCNVQGTWIDKRTVYLETDSPERTDESFRCQEDKLHHDGISPLLRINPPIDFIKQVCMESMHLLWLGIMKKFLVDIWLHGDSDNRFSQNQKKEFSEKLLLMSTQVPREFQRSTQSLNNISKWKATQFRFMALYIGPILLKPCLSEDHYKHFLLFHVACRILNSSDLALKYHRIAKEFMILFVKLSEKLYGKKNQVLNLHTLLHSADDVVYMGCPLSDITAFPFESALGSVKRMLRSGYRPLAQICRRICEQHLNNQVKAELPRITQTLRRLRPDPSGDTRVKTVSHKGCTLTTSRPNNWVILNDGKVLEIDEMFIRSSESRVRISGI
ncbi:uncharacterized protein LOC135159792 [Diachasmimorpha longicaudata]|uniref:uncharacterized protein LOC135159792 n=1 Tax=Diachasmimorpha longicaudata TaxID=58733 RepID=UPI0030B8DFB8